MFGFYQKEGALSRGNKDTILNPCGLGVLGWEKITT